MTLAIIIIAHAVGVMAGAWIALTKPDGLSIFAASCVVGIGLVLLAHIGERHSK